MEVMRLVEVSTLTAFEGPEPCVTDCCVRLP
jgi:hypothetical protein